MLRGEPIWQTSSTGPMSIPSSSDAVATRAFSSPARSRRSTRARRSFERLPWCAATTSSPSRSPSWCARRSASRRVFTNTRVVWCSRTRSAMRSSTSSICSADVTASSSPPGSSSSRSRSRWWPASTISGIGRSPTRRRATVSIGRWVADSPMRAGRSSHSASNRSSVNARCAPRLSRATAWISSRITVSVVRSSSRPPLLVTRRNSDSGVVTTKLGGWRSIAVRWELGVSPVRTATRMSGALRPSSTAISATSASGRCRFSAMSTASALSGET